MASAVALKLSQISIWCKEDMVGILCEQTLGRDSVRSALDRAHSAPVKHVGP